MRRLLFAVLALGLATDALAQISPADITTSRPRLFLHPDSVLVVTDRIGARGAKNLGSVSEYATIRDRVAGYSSNLFSLSNVSTTTTEGFENLEGLLGPMNEATMLYAVTRYATDAKYITVRNSTYTKLYDWLVDLRDEAQTFQTSTGGAMLSLSRDTGAGDVNAWQALGEDTAVSALWNAIDVMADTLATSDPTLRADLFEIAIAAWQKIHRRQQTRFNEGRTNNWFGYSERRYMHQLVILYMLLAHESGYDGLTMFGNEDWSLSLYNSRLISQWQYVEDYMLWDNGYGGGQPNTYNPPRLMQFQWVIPVHNAARTASPLTVGASVDHFTRAPRFTWSMTNRSYDIWIGVGEYGGEPQDRWPTLDDVFAWWPQIDRTYAFFLNDSSAIKESQKWRSTRSADSRVYWMEMAYADSLVEAAAVATAADLPTMTHFGNIYDVTLGPDQPGVQTTWRGDRDVTSADPWARSESRNGTLNVIGHVGSAPQSLDGSAGHHWTASGHLEIWYDGVLMSARGGSDQGTRPFAWGGRHKKRLLNTIQINSNGPENDTGGWPNWPFSGGNFNVPIDGETALADVTRMSWVSRAKSLYNGGHARYEMEASYMNDLVPAQGYSTSLQDGTFREVTVKGPYIVVRDHTVPAANNVQISSGWRKAAFDSLWTWNGTQTGGTTPNAGGGSPDAESTDSQYAEYIKPTDSTPRIKMRVTVPYATQPWKFITAQGAASDGDTLQGEWSSGNFDNGGDLSYEFRIRGDSDTAPGGGPGQRRTAHGSNPPQYPTNDDPWTEGVDASLDRGGYVGGGTLYVAMQEEDLTQGVDWTAIQVIELGPSTDTFAACSSSTAMTIPDSLHAIKIQDADSTFAMVWPSSDTLVRGINLDLDWTNSNGSSVIVHGLQPDTLTVWHDGDSLAVVVADTSGVVAFAVPDSFPNNVQLIPGGSVVQDPPPPPPTDDDVTAPTKPYGLSLAPSDTYMTVRWGASQDEQGSDPGDLISGLDRYVAYIFGGATFATYTLAGTGDVLPTMACVTGLDPGTEYCVQVAAIDAANNTVLSDVVCGFTLEADGGTDTTPPAAPEISANATASIIAFTWLEPGDSLGTFPDPSGIARYTFEWDDNAGGAATQETIFPPQQGRVFLSLDQGVGRRARVRATDNASNTGDWSDYVAATTPQDTSAPSEPDTVFVVLRTPTSLQAQLPPSIDPAPPSLPLSYQVKVMTNLGVQVGPLHPAFLCEDGTLYCADITGLSASTIYKLIARASDAVPNTSEWSDTTNTTTLATPSVSTPVPQGLNYRIIGPERRP